MEIAKRLANYKLAKYVRGLYVMLNNVGACFLSGAFVIDDRNHRLKLLLQASNDRTLVGLLKSHTSLHPYELGVCGGVCEVHLNNLPLSCGGAESRMYRNIKWYAFNNRADGAKEPERFVFLKLEAHTSLSPSHAINAVNRYVLHKEKRSSLKPRREDCAKDKAGCICDKHSCGKRYPHDSLGFATVRNGHCFVNEDTHERSGDEFFVPTAISDAILDNDEITSCNPYWI